MARPSDTGFHENFYPRPPRGGRPASFAAPLLRIVFLSTPSVRRATRGDPSPHRQGAISIHALREEGDVGGVLYGSSGQGFLSTPSARRATIPHAQGADRKDISIHALREEGDCAGQPRRGGRRDFYPRPPRGGRHCGMLLAFINWLFLSTPSARRATDGLQGHSKYRKISIHALREEGDPPISWPYHQTSYFYPRPPRGGRQGVEGQLKEDIAISIHALREEGDTAGCYWLS